MGSLCVVWLVAVSAVVGCGVRGVAGGAESTAVGRVVGVGSCLHELGAGVGPVVCVYGGAGLAQDADRVSSQYGLAEQALMVCAVAALPGSGAGCVGASLCGLAFRLGVAGSAVAVGDDQGASRLRAHHGVAAHLPGGHVRFEA